MTPDLKTNSQPETHWKGQLCPLSFTECEIQNLPPFHAKAFALDWYGYAELIN